MPVTWILQTLPADHEDRQGWMDFREHLREIEDWLQSALAWVEEWEQWEYVS